MPTDLSVRWTAHDRFRWVRLGKLSSRLSTGCWGSGCSIVRVPKLVHLMIEGGVGESEVGEATELREATEPGSIHLPAVQLEGCQVGEAGQGPDGAGDDGYSNRLHTAHLSKNHRSGEILREVREAWGVGVSPLGDAAFLGEEEGGGGGGLPWRGEGRWRWWLTLARRREVAVALSCVWGQ